MTYIKVFCACVILAAVSGGCAKTSVKNQQLDNSDNSLTGCKPIVHPERWPEQRSPVGRDQGIENNIEKLLADMTIEEKVGQIIQADISSITPGDVKKYNIGSVLNGGNSAPQGDNRIGPEAWLSLADEFWLASVDRSDGGVGIPIIWGTDAVHGHNNIRGATIFPHNIGLGAANDPALIQRIGEVTAVEIRITGLDWTFAPTIAVARNDRWGRTYESFSEDPRIVESYAGAYIRGLQGAPGADTFLRGAKLIATAKHFVGDGGTVSGKDQGDNQSSERELRDIQAAGYPVAIREGVQVVMASFNSWCGEKLHGFKPLLNDVLVERMGFDGFVVGDWNGHGQVQGCTSTSCARAFNAGIDMFMAPDSWRMLYKNTLDQVRSGEISVERLDQAVARILRVKFRTGLFALGKPSSRLHAGRFERLATPEHRDVAREAVRKSLVLLKNNNQLLPLSRKQHVLVAGSGADDIGRQAGGWTLSWQGDGNTNSDFPNGESVFAGIKQAVDAAGGRASLSIDGSYRDRPDVAVVVFGEKPYAEFHGDVEHLDFEPTAALKILTKLKQKKIPTVALFLSGRPLWVNPEINAADAFVAAWLPGSEGGGIADVIFRRVDNTIHHDFTGKLSFSWPNTASDADLNVGDMPYAPLFAYGYGLSYNDNVVLGALSEDAGLQSERQRIDREFMISGSAVSPWKIVLTDASGVAVVGGAASVSPGAAIRVSTMDDAAQEDTRAFQWQGPGSVSITGDRIDLSSALDGQHALSIRYRLLSDVAKKTSILMVCGDECQAERDVTAALNATAGEEEWQEATLGIHCFVQNGLDPGNVTHPFQIRSSSPTHIQFSQIKLVKLDAPARCW